MKTIIKYKNRKFYDTETSRYVNTAKLLEFLSQGTDFKILDRETKNDITVAILLSVARFNLSNKIGLSEIKTFIKAAI